jgi:uncharacterized protein (UPF0332 family)
MGYPEDLLEQAHHLAHRETTDPKQASLRRAVSTAYYALFHLLIDDAVENWAVERQRNVLARSFDHGKMKGISGDLMKSAQSPGNKPEQLFEVATAFLQLQQHRHIADYDIAKQWTVRDVDNVLELATKAFTAWSDVRSQDAAQDYLLDLMLPKLPTR